MRMLSSVVMAVIYIGMIMLSDVLKDQIKETFK
ncbi:hypothetical protein Q787_06215 [Ornithobacterium rhinotracheale H06-030791]|nr:hypothetical protein Q785_06060 [Ornithobacterium rhinotracheale ORT-UMN 88]AIQ00598.1 hypothetical protein Q785_07975 [Ornithobacterium rhinotracheale ORT-UMN 88]KGB66633.1 hypothetical protein Q787_06215 [Ornithobacterium rhinotracheale H06-030791]